MKGYCFMRNIKILDCTLRDGGRIIDCAFPDHEIKDITKRLSDANIDIVEVGFLRDWRNVTYNGNSTFFTNVKQIEPFIDHNNQKSTIYVAFVDFGMFDFNSLEKYDGSSINGIRVGFTHQDFVERLPEVIACMKNVQEKGYLLFVQGVNSLGYTDKELLEIIEFVNELEPYAFGIVDTYGAMYVDDVQRLFTLIDHNMKQSIFIDFHSHNNFQLSFALAQEVIKLSRGNRQIILDATLDGVGKCAGNLNTELIVDFLVRKMNYAYDFDSLLDIIDDYMYRLKQEHFWGYSIPSVMAGIYKSHPNNIIYLTEKFRLATKDIKHIISMIEPDLRQRYDYSNIQKLYAEYNHTKVDDKETVAYLQSKFENRNILVLMPGHSLIEYNDKINQFIEDKKPIIISVNFVCDKGDAKDRYAFFGSEKRYNRFYGENHNEQIITVSNINTHSDSYIVNYESLVERDNDDFDNSAIMLLNLLKRIGVSNIVFAGFDGFQKDAINYYDESIFEGGRFVTKFNDTTENMIFMLKKYANTVQYYMSIKFLTPSMYENIFKEK